MIVIAGQTASGKSALAMSLAQKFNGEIICADSRTIYKGMDIGTAKPSAQDRRLVTHHGLDLIEPDEFFSAAAFQAHARERTAAIKARRKLPILVGGTGLYIDGFVYDFSFAGEADQALRDELESMSLADLQTKAQALNIQETQVDFKNPRHLSRVIERTTADRGRSNSLPEDLEIQPTRKPKPKNVLILGMKVDREQLNERIEKRADTMFAEGLAEEVQNVVNRYGEAAPGLLAAGYKPVAEHLKGRLSLNEAKELFIRSHKYLAKRQQTWFKRNQDINWVQSEDEAIEKISKFTQV